MRLVPGQEVTVSCARGARGEVFDGAIAFERTEVRLDDLPELGAELMLILADPDRAFEHARLPVQGVGLVRQEFVAAQHIGIHPLAALHPESISPQARREIERLTAGHASPAAFWEQRLVEGIATIAAAFHPRRVIVRLSLQVQRVSRAARRRSVRAGGGEPHDRPARGQPLRPPALP
jgi:pyruvate,water dikinase